jgi:hypothetical protein
MRRDPTVIRACYLMGLSSAIRSYLLSARGLLQGLNRFDLETVTVVADRLLLLILGVAALRGGYGIFGLSLAFVAARVLMFIVVTVIVKHVTGSAVPTYDRAVWLELQTAALPLGFFLITLTFYTYIDTVILGTRTDAETGWLRASPRLRGADSAVRARHRADAALLADVRGRSAGCARCSAARWPDRRRRRSWSAAPPCCSPPDDAAVLRRGL